MIFEAPKGKCDKCGKPAPIYCDWPAEKFVMSQYGELVVGDTVRRATDPAGHARGIATVARLRPFFGAVNVVLHIRFGTGTAKEKAFQVMNNSRVLILKPSKCDALCCVDCAREVGPHRHYCPSHWHTWETV